jgi:hypothetical protein
MSLHSSVKPLLVAIAFICMSVQANVQAESGACPTGAQVCVSSCARFDKGDARLSGCENFCRVHCEPKGPLATPESTAARSGAIARTLAKKGDVLEEREQNGRLMLAMSRGNLQGIRRLVETEGVDPTYVYAYDFNPQTRQYDGKVVRLRLTDILNDTNELRSDDKGIDKILALLIELGMDVNATLDSTPSTGPSAPSPGAERARTAWGPSLKVIEKARDREARIRAFEIALQHGLQPNDDVGAWLFAEFPEVCGRDRSQFAIQMVDLLSKYLGTSLQEDLWREGERGPVTLADVLDRMMSPGRLPRSNSEKAEFARMDEVWQNCSALSHRINRYLMKGD